MPLKGRLARWVRVATPLVVLAVLFSLSVAEGEQRADGPPVVMSIVDNDLEEDGTLLLRIDKDQGWCTMVGYRLERKTQEGWKTIYSLVGRTPSLGIDEPMYSRWGPKSGWVEAIGICPDRDRLLLPALEPGDYRITDRFFNHGSFEASVSFTVE